LSSPGQEACIASVCNDTLPIEHLEYLLREGAGITLLHHLAQSRLAARFAALSLRSVAYFFKISNHAF
jgi:hypothetical protein